MTITNEWSGANYTKREVAGSEGWMYMHNNMCVTPRDTPSMNAANEQPEGEKLLT